MSNRAQRRQMMRAQVDKGKQLEKDYTRQQIVTGLLQNGITIKDLEANFEKGMREGFRIGGEQVTKCCYAAVILALKEDFGFSNEQCYDAVYAVDRRIVWAIGHEELARDVLEKTGINMRLDEPLERIQKVDKEE